MESKTLVAFAIQILSSLPMIFQVGKEALEYIQNNITALKQMQLEGRDPNDAEWDAINKLIDDLRKARPDIVDYNLSIGTVPNVSQD